MFVRARELIPVEFYQSNLRQARVIPIGDRG